MKTKTLYFILTVFLAVGCSDIEQDGMDLPDVSLVTPETILTELPIVTINTTQEDFNQLYDLHLSNEPIKGTMDMYNQHLDPIILNKSVHIELKGSSSLAYELKSLGISFDTTLNNARNKVIDEPNLRSNHFLDSLKVIRLRNSGQDFTRTMIKDMAYIQFSLLYGLDFEIMYGNSASHVFVNNQYYGLLNIRSESNLKGISKLLGKPESDVVIYKVDSKNQNIEHKQGDINLTPDLEKAIDDYSPEELSKLIDVSSFIDYLIFQDYIGNFDWPHNNIRMHNIGKNGFRFILYDLDWAAMETKNAKIPELEYLNYDLAKIYQKFIRIDGFEKQLQDRQKALYNKFKVEDFFAIVDKLAGDIKNDIPYQIAKYGYPESMYQWKRELEIMKRDFERRDHHIRKKYDLTK